MKVKKLLKKCFSNQTVVIMCDNEVLYRDEYAYGDFSYYENAKVQFICSNISDELVIHIYGQ